jgi:uncharacterized protein (DUF362 family)
VLQVSGGLLAAGAVAAGGYWGYGRHQRFGREALHTIPDHRVKRPATAPRMVIAHGQDPAQTVRAAVARMGGIAAFVIPGETVLIKPNIGWRRAPEQGANTHPEVVAELVRACKAARAGRVIVSDCPVQNSRAAFVTSGIYRAALLAGAEVIVPEESRHLPVQISKRLGTWDVLEPFVVADKIINVPVAKHHSETWATGGMKNWIGITLKLRMMFHNDIHQSIAELAALMRPTLTVLDASRVLMRNGPQGGGRADVKQLNTVAASLDPVAVDAWGCSLLGTRRDKLPPYLKIGERMGLGQTDWKGLSPLELTTG